jgi:hypothetical protein
MTDVLHLGCGRKRDLREAYGINVQPEWRVQHLDADWRLGPDLVCTLGAEPIPLADDSIDLVVAWHVLEHIGKQGESAAWFAFWEDLYRVMRPGAGMVFECPYYTSIWAWSDPTHTRAVSEHSFLFFNQDAYRVPGSMISPYRIACDFQFGGSPTMPRGWTLIPEQNNPGSHVLRGSLVARKPLKTWWTDGSHD